MLRKFLLFVVLRNRQLRCPISRKMRNDSQRDSEAMSQEGSMDPDERAPTTAVAFQPVLTITAERLRQMHKMELAEEEQQREERKESRKIKSVVRRALRGFSRK